MTGIKLSADQETATITLSRLNEYAEKKGKPFERHSASTESVRKLARFLQTKTPEIQSELAYLIAAPASKEKDLRELYFELGGDNAYYVLYSEFINKRPKSLAKANYQLFKALYE